jgi:hypothetical protein
MADVVGGFLWGEVVEETADEFPESVDGSGLSLAQQFLEFGKGHLDRIEIRAVGRQKQQSCACSGNERAALSSL